MKKFHLLLCTVIFVAGGCTGGWKQTVKTELPELGHRNWIVVADSAYPKQSAPGIETIYTGCGQLETLAFVLNQIETAPHVRAVVMLDAELAKVPEADAPGVNEYRRKLQDLLKDRQVKVMPHEEIIHKLDAGSREFNVLLLKTNLTLPYTSVFLELDCGYWDADKEKKLRDSLKLTSY